MRGLLALMLIIPLAGCGLAKVEQSIRNEVAITKASYERNILWPTTIKVRAQQVLIPSRADGIEEFCSTSPVIYGGARPQPMCFQDPKGEGRFTLLYDPFMKRDGSGREVDIPYNLTPFPCSSCRASSVDLTYVTDPMVLAEQSIAPPQYRPLVQTALSGSLDLDAAISRAYPNDAQSTRSIVDIAVKEIRDRRATAICSAQNPGGGAAMLGIIGGIAALAGGASDRSCINEYTATGVMPIPPARLPDAGTEGR